MSKKPKKNKPEVKAEKTKNPQIVQASIMLGMSGLFVIVAVIVLCSLGLFNMIGGFFIPRGEVVTGTISKETQVTSLGEKDVVYLINNNIVFDNTYTQGSIMIENPKVSKYNLQFTFYRSTSLGNAPVYESPMLAPGECIKSDKLTDPMQMKKGTFNCLCVVEAYDDDGNYCGRNTCTVTIRIENN